MSEEVRMCECGKPSMRGSVEAICFECAVSKYNEAVEQSRLQEEEENSRHMTVEEAIAALSKFDPKTRVGVVASCCGHTHPIVSIRVSSRFAWRRILMINSRQSSLTRERDMSDIVVRVGDAVYRRGDTVTLRPLGTLWGLTGKIIKNHEGVWCLLVGEFSAPLHCFDCEVMEEVG